MFGLEFNLNCMLQKFIACVCVQAQETAQLEEQLQGWREVILAGDRVLRWERPWFPGALVGATTMVFL